MMIPDWVILILLALPPFLGVLWVYGTWKNWKVDHFLHLFWTSLRFSWKKVRLQRRSNIGL